jgi:hypothetical protein
MGLAAVAMGIELFRDGVVDSLGFVAALEEKHREAPNQSFKGDALERAP